MGNKLIWYLSASTPLTCEIVISFLFLNLPNSLYSIVFWWMVFLLFMRIDLFFDIYCFYF